MVGGVGSHLELGILIVGASGAPAGEAEHAASEATSSRGVARIDAW